VDQRAGVGMDHATQRVGGIIMQDAVIKHLNRRQRGAVSLAPLLQGTGYSIPLMESGQRSTAIFPGYPRGN
jgi:hypothetical protein